MQNTSTTPELLLDRELRRLTTRLFVRVGGAATDDHHYLLVAALLARRVRQSYPDPVKQEEISLELCDLLLAAGEGEHIVLPGELIAAMEEE